MKRITAILLILVTVFSLASCKGGKTDEPETAEYTGELFGPVALGEGEEDIYVGVDTSFIHIFKASETKIPFQSFTTSGFDDVSNCIRAIRAEDVNFDGKCDLIIPFRRVDDYQYYYVYICGEGSVYSFEPSMTGIGNIEVGDGFLTGISSEHGLYKETRYFWVDGVLEDEDGLDEQIGVAEEYAKGVLGKDALSLSFIRDELVDRTISKLYIAEENGEQIAYFAVSYDGTRVFYSPMSQTYFEIVKDGGEYSKGLSYEKLDYNGVPLGYAETAYEGLSDNQKEYYEMIGDRLRSYEDISFESPDAAEAMRAYMKDHPVWSLCFVPEIVGNSAGGYYCCTWDSYRRDVDKAALSGTMDRYKEKIRSIVSEMPTGLAQSERYVYLAEKLQITAEEEHHDGAEDGLSVYIPGDSLNEKAAKTYAFMCETAELYCSWDGEYNVIMDADEKLTVSVYDAFAYPPGSDEWINEFYSGEKR
ncbi:MAG: hypothetical protein IJK58_04100 [Clostridia bacterium]|nr:hypothetical protein [Clostridia bacterium]